MESFGIGKMVWCSIRAPSRPYYELAGRERITRYFELFEREVCCDGSTYTQSGRMRAGPDTRTRVPTIISVPPPMKSMLGIRQFPTGCMCPASPEL
jgi:hypothetical protein